MIRYNVKLDQYIRNMDIIPYRLQKRTMFRTSCYYWIDYWEKWFKVNKVSYSDDHIPELIGLDVRWQDGCYGHIETDLTTDDFLLEIDKFQISNKNIFNTEISYTGAQIEYWIFRNHNDDKDPIYRMMTKYLDQRSRMRLDPFGYYFLYKEKKDGRINIYAKRDRSRTKFGRRKR